VISQDPLVSRSVGLGKEATVLLVLSPDCDVCEESMPFYRTLLAQPRMDGKARRLVVLTQGGLVPVQKVLEKHSFRPHGLTSGPAAVREVPDVPTVVVLNGFGKRLGTWAGRLTVIQQTEILQALGSK
jgi:hypothetical protein